MASEGEAPQTSANPRWLGQSEARLKVAYRAWDRKRKFSHGWRLANKRVAQLHAKIARQRLDFHHGSFR
jgi:putative transposase